MAFNQKWAMYTDVKCMTRPPWPTNFKCSDPLIEVKISPSPYFPVGSILFNFIKPSALQVVLQARRFAAVLLLCLFARFLEWVSVLPFEHRHRLSSNPAFVPASDK